MTDARSNSVAKPQRRSVRWTSFVGSEVRGRTVRGLEEEGNPRHRVRVEHNQDTLLVHISDEDGHGWTTLVIDRATREWSIAQRPRQMDAAMTAYNNLYVERPRESTEGNSKMNTEWHRKNRMPKTATLEQRVAWHIEHARECGCRPMPESVRSAIAGE